MYIGCGVPELRIHAIDLFAHCGQLEGYGRNVHVQDERYIIEDLLK